MRFIATDTETTMIAGRRQLSKGAALVNLSPFVPPRLIVGSWWDGERGGVLHAGLFLKAVEEMLCDEDTHLVFHNAPFDVQVIMAARPDLRDPIYQALAAGRIHDTMYLDMLRRLARGEFDKPRWPTFEVEQLRPRTLAVLAKEYAGMDLDKDEAVRCGFDQFEHTELPETFRAYAQQDAVATYRVWEMLRSGVDEKLLSEPLQTRAAVAVAMLDRRGVRIDREEAARLRVLFAQDLPELEARLVEAGLGDYEPVPGTRTQIKRPYGENEWHPDTLDPRWTRFDDRLRRVRYFKRHVLEEEADASFHLYVGAVRAKLELLVPGLNEDPERTPTGLLKVDAEWWRDQIPAADVGLQTWLQYAKLTKILSTYLDLYVQTDEVYARWNVLGARSGRMACASPNIQNIPKRKHGIRSLFVPHEGKVFVKADYSTQELLTLAEAMLSMGIRGPLLSGIQGGVDLHKQTARMVLSSSIKEIIEWPNGIERQLLAFLAADESHQRDAGSTSAGADVDTERWVLEVSAKASTASPSASLSEPSPTGGWSVIPATTLDALTRSISSSDCLRTTLQTWQERVVPEAGRLTIPDLARRIGRAAFLSIIQRTCALAVPVSKAARQAAKALNFGIPGGLGAAKLAEYAKKEYGQDWDLKTAKQMRQRYLAAYPDVATYLERCSTDFNAQLMRVSNHGLGWWREYLGVQERFGVMPVRNAMRASTDRSVRGVLVECERAQTVVLPSGRIRKGCMFTEAANTYFQGTASDVTKQAAFLCERRRLVTVLIVHDEIVIECMPEEVDEQKKILEECMLRAFCDICPAVGPYAKVEVEGPLARWGAATTKSGVIA